MDIVLEEGPYKLVKRLPLNTRIKEVNEELDRIKDEFNVNLLHLRNSNPTIPKFYGPQTRQQDASDKLQQQRHDRKDCQMAQQRIQECS
jgi:hypothetical protein